MLFSLYFHVAKAIFYQKILNKTYDTLEKIMNPIKLMVNGIPGNMAAKVAEHIVRDSRFLLIPFALTGPEITGLEFTLKDRKIRLISPENRDKVIAEIRQAEGDFLCVDYTHPSAAAPNAEFYCKWGIPFVMGTTGGDRNRLSEIVQSSAVPAVIAPNMAKQIVGFQAMMEYAANTFPGIFNGYSLSITESHQQGKADTSGTAKDMVGYFNKFGVPFSNKEIQMIRDPEVQKKEWGIPEEYLKGHGWHTYTLISDDKSVKFSFTHNVNGRDVYAQGTLDAAMYLARKVSEGVKGKVFSMMDVLRGA
jgi:4-hydroxy-tetrahydrodipicolinate reductase